MDVERVRAFCLELPHVVETRQWGDSLLFWVGDKAIGGKMFAVVDLGRGDNGVIWYSADPEHFAELVEMEGIVPAPYLARLHWVSVEQWGVHRNSVWEEELRAAHALKLASLPAKTKAVLALPAAERKRVIAARKKVLAVKEAAKKAKVKG
jgi:predicted DNA-binding protein (MmcQ/YjbR family)